MEAELIKTPQVSDIELVTASDSRAATPVENQDATEFQGRESQASELVNFVRARCDLVHDENSNVYAIDKQTRELRHIEHRAFRDWLSAAYYGVTQRAIRTQSRNEALQTLAGIGRHDGQLVQIHIRCAAIDGAYIIDLGEPGNSRAILVQPGSWRVVDNPGVMFARPESLKPLPEPVVGTSVESLWPLLNLPIAAHLLVLTWLIDSLRPDTPFPLLELIGEQGSAKSLTQMILRNVIDPSTTDLRSVPKSSEDVFVGAGANWLLAYDNVSHLSADLQDTFCRVSTGAAHATRRLYTNAEESVIRAKRPVSINGIVGSITAQDLVDRSVSLELPHIEDRRERGEIEKAFARLHSSILGGLLNVFSEALARLPQVQIPRDRRPRLIEFARLGFAVAEAVGKTGDDFLKEYETAMAEAIGRTLDASPVATALIDWLQSPSNHYGERTVKELYSLLQKPPNCEAWPRSPKGLADALRRAAPALRTQGINVRMLGKRGGSSRVSVMQRRYPEPSPASPVSPADEVSARTSRTFRTSPNINSEGYGDAEVF